MSVPTRSLFAWLAPLALGALVCALLWLAGLPELGWVGFLIAAFAWPTVRQSLAHRRPAPDPDTDRDWGRGR